MPRKAAPTTILAALAVLAASDPSRGDEVAGPGPLSQHPPRFERPDPPPPRLRHLRHAPAAALPPEQRYRDPRYVPAHPAPHVVRPLAPLRQGPRFGAPPVLIEAYLPRYTELPMYNEPPTRFPAHW